MRSVLVDPDRRTARVGPGATWGDVIEAAAPFGLAPVSGTNSTVGVTGFTFGGGHGFLARKYGLGADNLLRADLVTADGELITATPERRSELFWALGGAGGNFGVATSLEVRLHPVRSVFGGSRDVRPRARAAPAAALRRVHAAGRAERLDRAHRRRRRDPRRVRRRRRPRVGRARPAVPGRAARATRSAPCRSRETETIGGTRPLHFELLRDVPVDAILQTAAMATEVEVKRWGGAIARGTTPAGHRHVPFSVTVNGPGIAPLKGHVTGGSFLNWLHDDRHAAYTPADLARLQELKAAYDPDNVFGVGRVLARAAFAVAA